MKLSSKINFTLFTVFAFLTMFGFVVKEYYGHAQVGHKLEARTNALKESSRADIDEITTNLLLQQNQGIVLYLEAIEKRDNLLEASLVSDSQYASEVINERCLSDYEDESTCVVANHDDYVLYVKLRYGNSDFGYLKKRYTIRNDKVFVEKDFFKFALILVFLILTIVFIVISLMLRRIVVKPLRNICAKIEPLKYGNFSIQIPDQQTDELKQFANNIRAISNEFKRYHEQETRNSSLISIGQATSMVAHDVRKPLTGIKAVLTSFTHLKDNPEQIKKMIASVDRSIAQTNAMLNDILEFSKDSASLEKSNIDPLSVITSSFSDVFTSFSDGNSNKSDVTIIYDLKHKNYLNADGNRILRVFVNIIGNAVEAMGGKGKIWFKTEDRSPPLEPSLHPPLQTWQASKGEGEKMVITIGNDGPVIPEDVQQKLFEPFFTKDKKGGSGLGLSISQKIIDMHGGKIGVSSWKENGENKTEFVIELAATSANLPIKEENLIHHSNEFIPFIEEGAAREQHGDTANTAEFMRIHKKRGRPSTLLIVDDEPLFRETMRVLLSTILQVKDHIKVFETDSAEAALALFNNCEFDYVISDIDMGKNRMNGYDMSRTILETYKNTHVIIHSNKRREEMDKNIREVKSSRFMGFLPKPMNQSELVQFLACNTFEVTKLKAKAEGKRNVLLVNDDESFLIVMKTILRSYSVQVMSATNVNDALVHLTKNNIDIVLSDVNLGDGEPSGYELLKQVRNKGKAMPFYMVSGYSISDEAPKAKALGATGYIQLPIEESQLEDILGKE